MTHSQRLVLKINEKKGGIALSTSACHSDHAPPFLRGSSVSSRARDQESQDLSSSADSVECSASFILAGPVCKWDRGVSPVGSPGESLFGEDAAFVMCCQTGGGGL